MEEVKVFKDERTAIEKLKGFVGLAPGKILYVVPPIFKEVYPGEPDKWPVYKLKPPDGIDFNSDLNDGLLDKPVPGVMRMHELRRGVLDWKNHTDDGVVIPCVRDERGLTDDSIRALRPELQSFLLRCLNGSQVVTKEESEGLKF